ncbi:MAG: phosphotransferase [Rhodobacter sp.]|nr:phosphotransferase [Rhodobacter sp.]
MSALNTAFAHWGVRVVGPLPGGHRNAVWLVERGPELCVAKTTRRTEAALAWLGPVQALARRCGIGAPGLLRDNAGRFAPGGVTLEPFLAGRAGPPGWRMALAPRVAAFHKAAAGMVQRPGFCSVAVLRRVPRGGDIDLSAMPPRLVQACRAAWAGLGPESVLHGDLVASNVIGTATGPALVDWDECRRDAVVLEAPMSGPVSQRVARARLAWEVAACWRLEPGRARRLVRTLLN